MPRSSQMSKRPGRTSSATALDSTGREKIEVYAGLDALKKEVVDSYPEDDPGARATAGKAFGKLKEKIFREDMLGNKRRPDGRKFSEIRPITCEVGWLPRVHGSSLFTRGETQAIVTTTLGTKMDGQFMDDLEKGNDQSALHAALQFSAVFGW